MWRVILLVLAALCFLFLAVGWPVGDLRLLPLGLLFWVLADLLGGDHSWPWARRTET